MRCNTAASIREITNSAPPAVLKVIINGKPNPKAIGRMGSSAHAINGIKANTAPSAIDLPEISFCFMLQSLS